MAGDLAAATVMEMPAPLALDAVPELDPEEEAGRLLADLRTQADGLDEREAARRLQQFGPNAIRRDAGRRWWRSVLDQFTHPLALLLWMAAGLSLATGVVTLAGAIVVVIVLNAAFAFAQERQAEHAAFELVFAAALIYLPPLQSVFHTAALGLPELALLVSFPVIVWGSDELRRAWNRRHEPTPTGAP